MESVKENEDEIEPYNKELYTENFQKKVAEAHLKKPCSYPETPNLPEGYKKSKLPKGFYSSCYYNEGNIRICYVIMYPHLVSDTRRRGLLRIKKVR